MKAVTLPPTGDHGTGTAAATAGTVLLPVKGEEHNRTHRRVRVSQVELLKAELSQRQYQAAVEIEDAWCRVEMLSSGGELREQVDHSPRPDATVAVQVDAQSRYIRAMSAVPSAMRDVVEHICCKNLPLSKLAKGRKHYNRKADLKVALDLVANKLRY